MNFLILALSTYRITLLLTKEDGPYRVFSRFRTRSGVYYDQWNKAKGINLLSRILACFYCCSIWVAIILSGIYWYSPLLIYLLWPFALSTVAIMIKDVLDGQG